MKSYNELIEEFRKDKKEVVYVASFNPRNYTTQLLNHYSGFLFSDNTGRVWAYDKDQGIWNECETQIRNLLRTQYLSADCLKKKYVEEIIADIKETLVKNRPSEPEWYLVNLQNGVFDVLKNKLYPHSPVNFFTSFIPHSFEEGNVFSEKIDGLFEEWVENKSMLYELCAYCLIRNYSYQKMFFLIGSGSNGKGTFTGILQRLLHVSNVSSVSLESLSVNRFVGAELYGKLANIAGEVNVQELKQTDLIKRLTGGDLIVAEQKFKNPFQFINTAKIIFSTNALPVTGDRTQGFYRRFYPISFPNSYLVNGDLSLSQTIKEEDIVGLLGYLLTVVMPCLFKNGNRFTVDLDTGALESAYEDYSNPLKKFIRECCYTHTDDAIPRWFFIECFQHWCRQNGVRVWSETEIGLSMKVSYPTVQKTFHFLHVIKSWRAYSNISFNDKCGYVIDSFKKNMDAKSAPPMNEKKLLFNSYTESKNCSIKHSYPADLEELRVKEKREKEIYESKNQQGLTGKGADFGHTLLIEPKKPIQPVITDEDVSEKTITPLNELRKHLVSMILQLDKIYDSKLHSFEEILQYVRTGDSFSENDVQVALDLLRASGSLYEPKKGFWSVLE